MAKLVGGHLHAGSGNQWRHKNDVHNDDYLFEMKRTGKTQITIKSKDLEDLRSNATVQGRIPVMHCEIGNRRFVVLTEDDFLELSGADI